MSFFDSQPAGRLLNRFSSDTESTDVAVRETIAWCLTCVGECVKSRNPEPKWAMRQLIRSKPATSQSFQTQRQRVYHHAKSTPNSWSFQVKRYARV